MFGFFDRNSAQQGARSSWLSLSYRGLNLAAAGAVLYAMSSDPNYFSPQFALDALLHVGEALTPGQFNDLLIGLNIGRIMQLSAEAGCGSNEQAASADILLHSAAVLSRFPQFAQERMSGLMSYLRGGNDNTNVSTEIAQVPAPSN